MSISAALNARLGFDRHILTVAMDQHSVHCMTEDMLDEWFRSLSPAEKAVIFDAHLGAPDLPSAQADGSILPKPFATGGILALNAVTEGLPTPTASSTLKTQLSESLAQLNKDAAVAREWPRHVNCRSKLGPVEVLR